MNDLANGNAFVKIQDLRKSYQMGANTVHALAGISLDIAPSTLSVVMGPSGSGKSTLLYLLGGLDRPTSGKVTVGGQALDEMDENSLALYRRAQVGFIFQSFNLVPTMSALENVAFPMRFMGIRPRKRKQRAMELLELVGLETRAIHKPTELSGGQQQMLAIARALVADNSLLLIDEPSEGLAPVIIEHMINVIRQLSEQSTVVLVEQNFLVASKLAEYFVIIEEGKSVASGLMKDLEADKAMIHRYLGAA
jgi:putative ABC transport system ATP-binding protein